MTELLESNVPRICREDFDKEAVEFLTKYCPEALQWPMAVPILQVARKRMGLRVVERRLSEDFSVLGQMCFTNGLEELYFKETDEYKVVRVRYGTMIIDPDTITQRNEGCKNNTIAHEAFHWHKHRDYYIDFRPSKSKRPVMVRSGFEEYDESTQYNWSDEDWMEWQARGIAPRILMPPQQFDEMVSHYIKLHSTHAATYDRWNPLHRRVVGSLAAFFKVSKESAGIRLSERGFSL